MADSQLMIQAIETDQLPWKKCREFEKQPICGYFAVRSSFFTSLTQMKPLSFQTPGGGYSTAAHVHINGESSGQIFPSSDFTSFHSCCSVNTNISDLSYIVRSLCLPSVYAHPGRNRLTYWYFHISTWSAGVDFYWNVYAVMSVS